MVFKGNDHIFEEMEGLRFKIGAKYFIRLIPDRRIIFIRWPVILPD